MGVTAKMLAAKKLGVSTAPLNINAMFKCDNNNTNSYRYWYQILPKFIVLQDYVCVVSSGSQDSPSLNILAYKIVNGLPVYIASKAVIGEFKPSSSYTAYTVIKGGTNSLLLIGAGSDNISISAYPITITDTQITMGDKYVLCTDANTPYNFFDCCYVTGNTAFLVYLQISMINGTTTQNQLRAMTITTSGGFISIGTPVTLGLPDSSKVAPKNNHVTFPIFCCAVSTSKVAVIQQSTSGANFAAIMPVTVSGTTLAVQPPNYSVSLGISIFTQLPGAKGDMCVTHGNCIATGGCIYISSSCGYYYSNDGSDERTSKVYCLDASTYAYLGILGNKINTMWVENDVAYFCECNSRNLGGNLYKATSAGKQNWTGISQDLTNILDKDFILGFSKGMAVTVHQEYPNYAILTAAKATFNGSSLDTSDSGATFITGENGKVKQISSLYFDTQNNSDYLPVKVQLLLNNQPFYTQTVKQSERLSLANCPIIVNPSDNLKVETTIGVSEVYVTAFGLEETI